MNNIFFDNFLGPKAENHEILKSAIGRILEWHEQWRRRYFKDDPSLFPADHTVSPEFLRTFEGFLKRVEEQPPYFSPRYSAQMLKDPTLTSILGYLAVILNNPNNHAYEGGPVTTQMELEVVDDLLGLCGFTKGWGHLCSGGSLANTEAMWAVRDLWLKKHRKPGAVFFSHMSHYSWKRICSILMIPDYAEVDVDVNFRMDLDRLENLLKKKRGGMLVVANVGTTGCGVVDDIPGIVSLKKKYGFHLHIDAAYGGYTRAIIRDANGKEKPFEAVKNILKREVYDSLVAVKHADSVTIDPHKQGALGYGCGSVIYKNEALRGVILNSAPYTYHITDKPNIGMYTLEGSRPGAVAAGCWLTHRTIPLNEEGYGRLIGECILTAKEFAGRLTSETGLIPLHDPDLDIFCFYRKGDGKKISIKAMNRLNSDLYERFSVQNPEAEFILSKFVLDSRTAVRIRSEFKADAPTMVTMRTVFLKHWLRLGKPSHLDRLLKVLKVKTN